MTSRDDHRVMGWLRSRGWGTGYAGWWHPDLTGAANSVSWQEAYRLQNAHDRATATARRNTDIRDADVGADDEWRRAAMAAIRRVAELLAEFTTDDVLELFPALEGAIEPRAWGPMMLYAAKDGLIAPTERYVSSSRKASNARAKRAWRSLVFGGHAPQPELTEHLDVLEAVGP